jgi:hypothetical protein
VHVFVAIGIRFGLHQEHTPTLCFTCYGTSPCREVKIYLLVGEVPGDWFARSRLVTGEVGWPGMIMIFSHVPHLGILLESYSVSNLS